MDAKLPPRKILVPAEPVKVEATVGAITDQIKDVRKDIATLSRDLETIRSAPADAVTIKAAIAKHVTEEADLARPIVTTRGEVNIRWSERVRPHQLMALLAPGAMVEAMLREVGTIEGGISDDERASKSKSIKADLLELERIEEALIEAAHGHGIDV